MIATRERWDSLPKVLRGTLIFGLGAAAASTFFLGRASAPNKVESNPQISYAVGVICANRTAHVSYYEDADEYRFHCTTPDGNTVDVIEVLNLDVAAYKADELHGFNKIVPITIAGQAIEFSMQGPDALATIYRQYTNNSGFNDPTIGIARVSN